MNPTLYCPLCGQLATGKDGAILCPHCHTLSNYREIPAAAALRSFKPLRLMLLAATAILSIIAGSTLYVTHATRAVQADRCQRSLADLG